MSVPPTNKTAELPSTNPSKSFWHVEPSPLLLGHRSTRELPAKADVVIIGSGITGTSVAWHLLQNGEHGTGKGGNEMEGVNVLMLEAREACWGATGRNGGHCQPILFEHPQDPQIGRFELSNYHALQTLCTSLHIACEFHAQPGVRAIYSSADLSAAETSLSALQRSDPTLAAHMRLITDKAELQRLRVPTALGAVVTDVAARLWPYKFVARMLEELLMATGEGGGRFGLQTHTAAVGLKPVVAAEEEEDGAGWEVVTARGSVVAKKVVLATNAYTSFLVKEYADLIVPVRGQMSALLPPIELAGSKRLTTSFGFLGEAQDDYLIQRGGVERGGGREQLLYGGGRSEGGLSLGVSNDDGIDDQTARYLRGALNTLLGVGDGGKEFEATHEWSGIMGFSRDNKPFVGPVPKYPGVFVSAGYTGHGMPNAWLCGKAVATMVSRALSGASTDEAVATAVDAGLPEAYVVSDKRVEEARTNATVEVQDQSHGFKAEYAE